MPWKKNFDVEEAVESAMEVFWEKGFESTTITDITEATGVQRQSLYNAVGDKRKLFLRSLMKYDTERRRSTLASIESLGTPLESIHAFFARAIEQSTDCANYRGCFLVNTALRLQDHDDEVRDLVSAALEDLRAFFKRLIDHGKVRGEIPSTVDASATASTLLAIIFGMGVMARGSCGDDVIRQAADQALSLLT
tara:strand:- start:2818 stop:3399 length:582 start_codon:yes stop_codon:yes gene_type:complete